MGESHNMQWDDEDGCRVSQLPLLLESSKALPSHMAMYLILIS